MRPTTRVLATLLTTALPAAAVAQAIDPAQVTRPDGVALHEAPAAELRARGAELFEDTSLSTNGMACATCHADLAQYNDTFAEPYPHAVGMASDMAGLEEVTAAQMVQLCMMVPMAAQPLPWDGVELAALTAYVEAERERFAETR
jgi:cytochrome c peroxidase